MMPITLEQALAAVERACGPGWSEHRPVYIAPQLVNYREGDEEPTPLPRVVKMGKG